MIIVLYSIDILIYTSLYVCVGLELNVVWQTVSNQMAELEVLLFYSLSILFFPMREERKNDGKCKNQKWLTILTNDTRANRQGVQLTTPEREKRSSKNDNLTYL